MIPEKGARPPPFAPPAPPFLRNMIMLGLSKLYDQGKTIEGYDLLEELPYTWEDLSAEELQKRMEDTGNVFNAPLVKKMSVLFADQQQQEAASAQEEPPSLNEDKAEVKLPLWKVYTPYNIIREIKFKFTGS